MAVRVVLALAVAAATAAGCGSGEAEADPIELVHSIHEPWQAEPFAVEQALVARAETACRDMKIGGPQAQMNPPLVAVDARGGSRLFLIGAQGNTETECLVDVDASGAAMMSIGGATSGGEAFGPLDPGAVTIVSGSSGGGPPALASVVGRAGPGVARVVVTLGDGRPVVATLTRAGWYAAWWPGATGYASATAYDGAGAQTGTAR